MQQYMLTVHSVEGSPEPSAEARQKVYRDVDVFNAELRSAGVWVFAGGLHPPDTATVVSIHEGGEVLVTDGPFAEGKEHIGGFWVIAAADLDAALAWAAKATRACTAPVEVRPFQNLNPD
ncbi:MAG TPA: YciI family protein [Candidatus Dormibacteraeota bacterium]|nr:YciI family protein [Candidatus Dormibacteraeota bacterium]